MAVSAQATPNLSVQTAAGVIQWGLTRITVAAVASLAISAGGASARIDLIYVTSAGTVAKVEGTPGASPKPPALPTNSILLAYVTVAAGAANVQNSNITSRILTVATELAVGTAIAVGATPASTGAIRLTNNTGIYVRNAANTADFALIASDVNNNIVIAPANGFFPQSDNAVELGWSGGRFSNFYAGGFIALGTNPSASGSLRLANNVYVGSRNAANNGDIPLIYADGTNIVTISQAGNGTKVQGVLGVGGLATASITLEVYGTAAIRSGASLVLRNATNDANVQLHNLSASSIAALTITAPNGVVVTGPNINVGTTSATSGSFNMPYGGKLRARNFNNTYDEIIIGSDSSGSNDKIVLGAAGGNLPPFYLSTSGWHGGVGSTTMANGFIYIAAAAGVPTGAANAVTGNVPLYYDTTNNRFYVYSGSWRSVLLA